MTIIKTHVMTSIRGFIPRVQQCQDIHEGYWWQFESSDKAFDQHPNGKVVLNENKWPRGVHEHIMQTMDIDA